MVSMRQKCHFGEIFVIGCIGSFNFDDKFVPVFLKIPYVVNDSEHIFTDQT